MSNRQLEDQADQALNEALAESLHITPDELEDVLDNWEPAENNEGFVHGYNVYFLKDANREILSKIPRALEQGWVRIGPVL
jgi:hypothetical protein